MFAKRSWTKAFINSIEREGGNIEEGLNTLIALAQGTVNLPSGSSAPENLEQNIMKKIKAIESPSEAQTTAIRFFVLMARKNVIRHITLLIDEVKKSLEEKRGIVAASIEYAFEGAIKSSDEFRIKEAIKKRTRAAEVKLTAELKPDLIGGYRLRIGDELIDASIRRQLQKMETSLAGLGIPLSAEDYNG